MHVQRFGFVLAVLMLGTSALMAQPTANFTANKLTGCSNLSTVINFQDASTGNPVSWLWNFGAGGSTSTLPNPTFVYTQAGCYTVTLTVTDANGLSNTLTQPCFIEVFQAPVPDFTVDNSSGCAPFTACFTSTTTASSVLSSLQWTFSDGSSGTGQAPCITFTNAPDTISLVLTVTDANGCSGFAQFPNIIQVFQPPVLNFAVNVNSACNPPLTVNVTNQTSTSGNPNPTYTWLFPGGTVAGGGSQATGFTPPAVTYTADGQYDITLIVNTANGCADTLTLPNAVGIGGVTAGFSASATTICAGDSIAFLNLSQGGVTSYEWNFGETAGINSTAFNPVYAYSTPGTYSVTLRANNVACGDTLVQTNLITVNPSPVAAFTIDRTQDCQPGIPFFFTNTSTGSTNRLWDFGDGTTSTQNNPQHTYAAIGTYDVCLIASNGSGCSDTVCQTITIEPIIVTFTRIPSEGCAPVVVQFNGTTNSTDPVVSWTWDLGAGATPATANVQSPSATYAVPGSYNVTLTILTQGGCTNSRTVAGAVRVGTPPQVDFTASDDTVCLSEPVTFTSTFQNANWNYYWDFQYVAPGNFTQMDSVATTMYPDTGTFSVALIVEDNGCRDTLIIDDLIYASPPRAQIVLDNNLVCSLPASVAITDSSIGPANVYNYYVNGVFYSAAQNPPPINITATGSYLITQTVLNTLSGCTDTFTTALQAGNPIAEFTVNTTRACRNEPITFNKNLSQNTVHHYWFYNFDQFPATSFVSNGTHQRSYADTGTYTVRLIAADQFGCRDTMTKVDLIDVVGPYANFAPDVTGGCTPLTVTFTDSTTTTALTNPVSWVWDFGNGQTSVLQNPSTTYTQSGNYDVSLLVTDSDGCQDSVTLPSLISVTFPAPDFSVVDSSTCAGAPVQFTNLSNGVGLQYLWKFGDGDTSTQADPAHAFPRDRSLPYDSTNVFYDVTLIVTDVNGCVDSITMSNAVYIEPFQAGFSGDPLVGICPPLNSQFSDSTIGTAVAWNWNFGDGFGQSQLQNPAYVYFLPGTFDVRLIATHEDGCQDTLIKSDYVQLAGPNGSFFLDRDTVCLGDTITLTLITTGAALVNPVAWQDGGVDVIGGLTGIADTVVVTHVYNSVGSYLPVVVVQDIQGCQVTLPDSPFVQVFAPPVALISPDNPIGCAPITISFTDSTSSPSGASIVSWDWDFGDGSIDSIANPVHAYQDSGVFVVNLRVEDEFGCSSTDSTVVVSLEGIVADFAASDTVGCSPLEISFSDLSFNGTATSWRWIFGDGDSSAASNPSHQYLQDGTYTVTLIVSDNQGCSDTLTRTNYIFLRKPSVSIEASDLVGCNPIDITFFARNVVSDTTISEYLWCLTEVNQNITVCTATPFDSLLIPFSEPGNYIMTVTVTDVFGCSGLSDTVSVDITNRGTPPPIVMRRVTVLDPRQVQVDWLPYQGTDFIEYAVYRLNGPGAGLITTITDVNAVSFTESNPALDAENNTYCYEVLVLNSCLEYSDSVLTIEHCSMDLETTPELDAIRLDWTAYEGFPVGQYEIYRTLVYDTTQVTLIGTVPGGTLTFTDTDMFCRDSVTYRVLAIGFGASHQRSYSDLSGTTPIHLDPVDPVNVIVATVTNNEDATISWTEYLGYLPDFYLIERSDDGRTWTEIGRVPLGGLSFTDTSALVQAQSYFYRVFAVDQCEDMTPEGSIGRTIFLQSQLDPTGKVPVLGWTPYEEWSNGVLNYEVQVFNDATGEWEPVDITNGNVVRYNDSKTTVDQATYCYRVVAYEVGGNGSQSVSNESCVIFGPAIFAPNAFTPNGDGENDAFKVFVPNAAQATLSIYNRWGELIFETTDPASGWPGTRAPGEIVQEGVYVFVVRGVGFDGTQFSRSGSVTLLR